MRENWCVPSAAVKYIRSMCRRIGNRLQPAAPLRCRLLIRPYEEACPRIVICSKDIMILLIFSYVTMLLVLEAVLLA